MTDHFNRLSPAEADEHCCACDQPTGRAGRGEDSLYAGDFGPYCEDCWCEVPEKLAALVATKGAEIRALKALISPGK